MFNLLALHRLTRNGDGLNPALQNLLSLRAAIEADPKVTILYPDRSFAPARAPSGRGSRRAKHAADA